MKSAYKLTLFKREEGQTIFMRYYGAFSEHSIKSVKLLSMYLGVHGVIGYEFNKLNSFQFYMNYVVPMERVKHLLEVPCLWDSSKAQSLISHIKNEAGL